MWSSSFSEFVWNSRCERRLGRICGPGANKMGFKKGAACQCVFKHGSRDLVTMFHRDDFVFSGPDAALTWVQARMEAIFLTKVIGRRGGDAARLLGGRAHTLRDNITRLPNNGKCFHKRLPLTGSGKSTNGGRRLRRNIPDAFHKFWTKHVWTP